MTYRKPFSQTQTLDPFGHKFKSNTLLCATPCHHVSVHLEVHPFQEKDSLP